MTTQNSEEKEISQTDIGPKIVDAINVLLEPYEPVSDEATADHCFTTNEIIAALEEHFGIPQGDVSYQAHDAGRMIINRMQEMNFICKNTGGLKLEWLMKKKISD